MSTMIDKLRLCLQVEYCPESQADGVSCPSAANDCARCVRARAAFETLQLSLGLP
jgi:hypothetical protein